jgi:hypothetical protein
MRFLARVLLGVTVGLAAILGLHFVFRAWWIGALVGGLAGALMFLATFFVWTADRPEEGYEQVLFDLPNTVVAVALILVLASAGFAGTLFHGKAAPDPAAATMAAEHGALVKVYDDLMAGKLDASGVTAARSTVASAQDALAKLPPSPDLAKLQAAAKAELTALDDYAGACGMKLCQTATLDLLDAKDPLDQYR